IQEGQEDGNPALPGPDPAWTSATLGWQVWPDPSAIRWHALDKSNPLPILSRCGRGRRLQSRGDHAICLEAHVDCPAAKRKCPDEDCRAEAGHVDKENGEDL